MELSLLKYLHKKNSSINILRSNNMPLIVGFFWKIFISTNQRQIDEETLKIMLDDYLYSYHKAEVSRTAKDYLNSWVDSGYLKVFYSKDDDIPKYELTHASEKVIEWIHVLQKRDFIGTESKLKNIFENLRSLGENTETNKEKRLEILRLQKEKIDKEILDINQGRISVYDEREIRERFNDIEDNARRLLHDFSEVESNFNQLNKDTREKIALSNLSKSEVLETIFNDSDLIKNSDQGKSFSAFCEFLLIPERQDEFDCLINYIYNLESIKLMKPSSFLAKLKINLIAASNTVLERQLSLSHQLRHFLDEYRYFRDKEISYSISKIKNKFLIIKNNIEISEFKMHLIENKISINSIIGRRLFEFPISLDFKNNLESPNNNQTSMNVLFSEKYIDKKLLYLNIKRCLEDCDSITLSEILEKFPLKNKVLDIIEYINIAEKDSKAKVLDRQTDSITIYQDEIIRKIIFPKIIFNR